MEFKHKPVLLEETIEGLKIKEDGIYVDGTLGGAGHSKEILKRLSSKGMLIGIDRDEEALKAAKEKPIVFDEDCPETTPERALKFRRVNPPRGAGKKRA